MVLKVERFHMSAPTPLSQPDSLSETQKAALLKLLVDDDPVVVATVRDRILESGPGSIQWLEPHTRSNDPTLRRRTLEIFDLVGRQQADRRFLAHCMNQAAGFVTDDHNSHPATADNERYADPARLEEGVWMLAQTRFPRINISAYQAILDDYALELRNRIDPEGSPHDSLACMNDFLFEELGFRGNEKDYYDPNNSYLNRVIDRKTGNPISLCTIYFLVGRRLRFPITGIGMPGHFLCRYQTPSEEIYIDAFNRGKLLSKSDCIRFLLQSSNGFQEGFLAASSPRQIILRMCTNLHQIYSHHSNPEESSRIQRYIVALAK